MLVQREVIGQLHRKKPRDQVPHRGRGGAADGLDEGNGV